jgi:NAD(P)-dependent dehydrogenase (short-subunit alcohol dehydrogenase family)
MIRAASLPSALVTILAFGLTAQPSSAQAIMPDTPAPSADALQDRRVALITGSTAGLGEAAALALGDLGWHVIVHGRNIERGRDVVREIGSGPGSATFYAADLASIDETARLGEAILRDFDRLDVLVNNAGIWLTGDDTRRTSQDGLELSFHVNYLSGFQLTHALLPLLRQSAPSRIVNVASVAQTAIDFDDVMLEHDYSGGRAYGQSKLAQILFTFDLAPRLEGTGVTVNALHPATLMDTNMVREAGVTPRATVEEGRDALLLLILSDDVGTGQYFRGQEAERANAQAYDESARAQLRALSEALVGG